MATMAATMRVLLLAAWATSSVRALPAARALNFSNVFGSNMVLQHGNANVSVWGWGPATSNVTVTLSNATFTRSWSQTSAAGDGAWRQVFPPLPLGSGPYQITAATPDGQTATLRNVLGGDVYWCGGQSNMQLSTTMAFNGSAEIAGTGSYSQIRVFSAGSSFKAKGPLQELGSVMIPWEVASPQSVGGENWTSFSAACWMFGRKLADALGPGHPLGLISNNYGGSTLGSWLEPSRFLACNQSHGEPPNIHGNNPSVIYNTFFTPYTGLQGPTAMKGVLWLQGEEEADLGYASFYPCGFPALVEQFRTLFGMGPAGYFGVIAVGAWIVHAPFNPGVGGGNEGPPSVRDTQLRVALNTPNMGWATAADCGDISSPFTPIHFRDKETPTDRIAMHTLARVYGRAVPAAAPLYRSASVSGLDVSVSLLRDPLDSGPLELRAGVACPPGVPGEFCGIAGSATVMMAADGNWYNATLSLTPAGDGLVLRVPPEAPPGAVLRSALGWFAWPMLTAYSTASGLPVTPWNCDVTGADCWA